MRYLWRPIAVCETARLWDTSRSEYITDKIFDSISIFSINVWYLVLVLELRIRIKSEFRLSSQHRWAVVSGGQQGWALVISGEQRNTCRGRRLNVLALIIAETSSTAGWARGLWHLWGRLSVRHTTPYTLYYTGLQWMAWFADGLALVWHWALFSIIAQNKKYHLKIASFTSLRLRHFS